MNKKLERFAILFLLALWAAGTVFADDAAVPPVSYIEVVDRNSTFIAQDFDRQISGIHENNYSIVSILGPKGSGKSRLFNSLFNTSFPAGRLQDNMPDPGILMGVSHVRARYPIVVLDLPGFDGKEISPYSVGKPLEGYGALFSLAVSKIMFYNIAYDKAKTHINSGLPFFSNIFRAYFTCFAKKQEKMNSTILFVFRNTRPKVSDLASAKAAVISKIAELWQNTSKAMLAPAALGITDVFDIKFTDLPEPAQGAPLDESALEKIRSIVYDTLGDTSGPVPVAGLFGYFKGIWSQAITERHVNLPSQLNALANERADQVAKQLIGEYLMQVRSSSFYNMEAMDVQGFNRSLVSNIRRLTQRYAAMVAGYGVLWQKKSSFYVALSQSAILDFKDYLGLYGSRVVAEYQNRTLEALKKGNASEAQLQALCDEASELLQSTALSMGTTLCCMFHCTSPEFDCQELDCESVNHGLNSSWDAAAQMAIKEFDAQVILAKEAGHSLRNMAQQYEDERSCRMKLVAVFRRGLEAFSSCVPMPDMDLLAEMRLALKSCHASELFGLQVMADVVGSFVYEDHMIRHVKSRFSTTFENRSEQRRRVFALPSDVVLAKKEARQNAIAFLDKLLAARAILLPYLKEQEETLRSKVLAALDEHELTVVTLETEAISYTGYLDYIDFGLFMALAQTGMSVWQGQWLRAGLFSLVSVLVLLKMVYSAFREKIWTLVDKAGYLWNALSALGSIFRAQSQ